eukprot:Gb_02242 [translate_table: standard]
MQQSMDGGERWRERWRGSVSKTMNSPPEKVWELAADFVGLNKWVSHIDICKHIEGERNKPGCVRYCSGNSINRAENERSWVKEKLVEMDHDNYSFAYSVIDGNLGLDGYVASFQLHLLSDRGALVEWSWEANPSNSCSEEQFVQLINSLLEQMIQRLDETASKELA